MLQPSRDLRPHGVGRPGRGGEHPLEDIGEEEWYEELWEGENQEGNKG